MSTPSKSFSVLNPSTWSLLGSSTPATADPAVIKEAETKLNTVTDECNKKIQDATTELNKLKALPLEGQPVVGGRRPRKSAKKSNKRRRPAKKSLFNITKKWNLFAK